MYDKFGKTYMAVNTINNEHRIISGTRLKHCDLPITDLCFTPKFSLDITLKICRNNFFNLPLEEINKYCYFQCVTQVNNRRNNYLANWGKYVCNKKYTTNIIFYIKKKYSTVIQQNYNNHKHPAVIDHIHYKEYLYCTRNVQALIPACSHPTSYFLPWYSGTELISWLRSFF